MDFQQQPPYWRTKTILSEPSSTLASGESNQNFEKSNTADHNVVSFVAR